MADSKLLLSESNDLPLESGDHREPIMSSAAAENDVIGERKLKMKSDLFRRIALRVDLPEYGLKKGDVATIVEHLPGNGREDGYAVEVFNSVGDTIAVITVPESAVEPLTADTIPSVRPLAKSA